MHPEAPFALALVTYNAVVMGVYGFDKWRAKRNGRRVRERSLLVLAACFGSLGALLGMRVFRHKTKKPAFAITVPTFAVVHVAAGLWWATR